MIRRYLAGFLPGFAICFSIICQTAICHTASADTLELTPEVAPFMATLNKNMQCFVNPFGENKLAITNPNRSVRKVKTLGKIEVRRRVRGNRKDRKAVLKRLSETVRPSAAHHKFKVLYVKLGLRMRRLIAAAKICWDLKLPGDSGSGSNGSGNNGSGNNGGSNGGNGDGGNAPKPTASPTPAPTATPTPQPTASPDPDDRLDIPATPLPTPTATPSPSPSPSGSPTPTPSPTPAPPKGLPSIALEVKVSSAGHEATKFVVNTQDGSYDSEKRVWTWSLAKSIDLVDPNDGTIVGSIISANLSLRAGQSPRILTTYAVQAGDKETKFEIVTGAITLDSKKYNPEAKDRASMELIDTKGDGAKVERLVENYNAIYLSRLNGQAPLGEIFMDLLGSIVIGEVEKGKQGGKGNASQWYPSAGYAPIGVNITSVSDASIFNLSDKDIVTGTTRMEVK